MAQQPLALTPDQVNRYSRHIIMSDVGSRGQRKLMQSKVLILGAGGLGSPSAIYLSLTISQLPKLSRLALSDTAITDDGLAELVNMKSLTTLDLRRTKITDFGLKELAGLSELRNLQLSVASRRLLKAPRLCAHWKLGPPRKRRSSGRRCEPSPSQRKE